MKDSNWILPCSPSVASVWSIHFSSTSREYLLFFIGFSPICCVFGPFAVDSRLIPALLFCIVCIDDGRGLAERDASQSHTGLVLPTGLALSPTAQPPLLQPLR